MANTKHHDANLQKAIDDYGKTRTKKAEQDMFDAFGVARGGELTEAMLDEAMATEGHTKEK